ADDSRRCVPAKPAHSTAIHNHAGTSHRLGGVRSWVNAVRSLPLPVSDTAGILARFMVSLATVSKRYGSQVVLQDVSWSVPLGARVGLTGPNGGGKYTILKILAGLREPDAGSIALPRGARVGYLPQHILGLGGSSVLDHALAAFAELHALEQRRTDLEHQLATVDPQSDEYAAIMDRYMAVCEEWD